MPHTCLGETLCCNNSQASPTGRLTAKLAGQNACARCCLPFRAYAQLRLTGAALCPFGWVTVANWLPGYSQRDLECQSSRGLGPVALDKLHLCPSPTPTMCNISFSTFCSLAVFVSTSRFPPKNKGSSKTRSTVPVRDLFVKWWVRAWRAGFRFHVKDTGKTKTICGGHPD